MAMKKPVKNNKKKEKLTTLTPMEMRAYAREKLDQKYSKNVRMGNRTNDTGFGKTAYKRPVTKAGGALDRGVQIPYAYEKRNQKGGFGQTAPRKSDSKAGASQRGGIGYKKPEIQNYKQKVPKWVEMNDNTRRRLNPKKK